MTIHRKNAVRPRASLFAGVAAISIGAWSGCGHAQSANTVPAASEQTGLTEIVVTAQKREQRLQDVPVAVTAITKDTLLANRITTVADLSGQAPNVTVRPAAGGTEIPSFSIRGIISYGVVPGSDKETSIYLDGVYIGSPRGSTFELPDIERIEVLRGPQGTLFGRNATTGAISIVTRDPTGTFGARQEFTVGNYNQFRSRTSVDLPAWGPFSAYVSYVHNQRRGDIRNLGAGQVWDYTGPNTHEGILVSPKYLGDHDANSYFAAVKFQPSDSFRTVYKFDHTVDDFTPDGEAAIAVNPAGLGPAGGAFLDGILAAQTGALLFDPSNKRPDAVNNSFATPGVQRVTGHNLTSTLKFGDNLSLKNILAFRKAYIVANVQLDGLGGLVYPYPPIAGAQFEVLAEETQAKAKQLSDELQLNYSSKLLTLTVGALYYHQKDRSGGAPGITNNLVLTAIPDGRIPLGNEGTSYNLATSIAAYTQAEVHVTSQIDIVGGLRLTHDKKSGTFISGDTFVPGPNGYSDGTFVDETVSSFQYHKTKPSYSGGINFKPTAGILIYGKYSYAFVSGGAVGDVSFKPETASSFEIGAKTDLLDRRLSANVALFDVKYKDLQSAQSGVNVGRPQFGTVIVDQGDARAKGFELELNAAPVRSITLGASLGYTDIKYSNTNPILPASVGGTEYLPSFIPKWTANFSAQYRSSPLFDETHLVLRADANWRSKERTDSNPDRGTQIPAFAVLQFSPASWVINARASLQDIKVGPTTVEVALWARNLNNNRSANYPLILGGFTASSTFQAARTFGVDLNVGL